MSDNNYIIPLGVDAEKLVNPLNDVIGILEKTEAAAKTTGKAIQESFEQGSKSASDIEQKLKPVEAALVNVVGVGKQVGKELGEAFNEKNMNPAKLDKAIDAFKKKLQDITGRVDIEIDPAKLAVYEKQLAGAKNAADELAIALNIAKDVMSGLDPKSEEFQQMGESIKFVEEAVQGFANTANLSANSQKTLRSELTGVKNEIDVLKQAGDTGSETFVNLTKRAAELQNQLDSTNKEIKNLASDTGTFDGMINGALGLVGAFTAVTGAQALFGEENEELEKAMQKVMGAMAVLQGLQQVAETLNKDSAFSTLFLSKIRTIDAAATTAQNQAIALHTAASIADQIATDALIAATVAETAATAAAVVASEAHAVAQTEETAANLAAATTAQAEATALRVNAAAELAAAEGATLNAASNAAQTVAMGGATVAAGILGFALKAIGIGLIITAVAALVEYWDELTGAMKELLPAGFSVGKMFDNIKSIAFGVGEAIVKFVITPFKAAYQAMTGDFEGAFTTLKKGYNVADNFTQGRNRQNARNEDKYRNEKEQKDIDAEKRDLERRAARGEKVAKLQEANQKKQIALLNKQGKDTKEQTIALEDFQDKQVADANKKREAAGKKAEADRKKAADKARQAGEKAAAEAKKQADLILKYTNEINSLRVNGIEDSYQQEREKIKAASENKIRDLKNDEAKTAAAVAKRAELILAIETSANAELKELETKHNSEIAALRLDGAKMLQTLAEDSKQKSLALLEIENAATIASINEKFKNENDLRAELLKAQAEYLIEERKKVALKADQQEADLTEQRALALLSLARNQNGESIAQEEQYQLALLDVKRQGAEKALALLLESGKGEGDIEVLNARLKIKAIQDAIADQAAKGKKFDMMKFLGIGSGWSSEEMDAVKQAAGELLNNISNITDGLVEQYQRQIDKKQESIDQYNEEIDDLESQLDKEKDLRDNGFANNVEVLEKEIAAKKAQRDEEIRQQKEMQEKQAQIQRAQMAVDTAVQLVNMITSATNIYKSLSPLGPFGIGLAIATIGTMFGAFAIAKANAAKAVNDGAQKYRKGGWINGASHEQGGVKYYGNGGDVKELEGNEFVVATKPAAKFAPLLEAINSGNFNNLGFAELGTMGLFGAMGITFGSPDIAGALSEGKEMEAAAASINITAGTEHPEIGTISQNIKYLADRKRTDAETWEDAFYYYSRKGSRITRIKK